MQFSESFFPQRFGITTRDLENYLAEALSHGGAYADLYFEYLSTSSIGIDECIVKSASQGVSLGVGVRVIAGERTGYAYSAAHDDEAVWQLLRRLQILVFDFTATGSASEELAKERAARALHPEEASRAGNLWDELTELAIKIATAGGDRKRDELRNELVEKTFRLSGDRHNLPALAALAEASQNALADIDDRVGGVTLTRHERVASVHNALDRGRYVEIRGDAGVGKSGVLKHFAMQVSAEA